MINPYLDTLLAVAVVYFIFSVLAYVIQEAWAAFRESRGRMLRKAIYDLLNDNLNKGYGVLLFEHPQFNFLKKTDNRLPSYLPSPNFADALIDIISREAYDLYFPPPKSTLPGTSIASEDQHTQQTVVMMGKSDVHSFKTSGTEGTDLRSFLPDKQQVFELFRTGLSQMRTSNLKTLLQNIMANSTDLDSLRKNIEQWYNEYMDRVSGWYKSKVSLNLRWIGIGLAVVFNVHAFNVITSIYSDRQLRDKLVNMGENIANNNESFLLPIYNSSVTKALAEVDNNCNERLQAAGSDSLGNIDSLTKAIRHQCQEERIALADSFARIRYRQAMAITDSLKVWDLPIGWKMSKGTAASATGAEGPGKQSWFWYLIGWIVSGFAISAGAPFWFGVINRLVAIRRTGKKPEPTPPASGS